MLRPPMAAKEDRLALIRSLVESADVSTQTELIRALRKKRFSVDQSTLSRDLAELGIRKSGGRYLPPAAAPRRRPKVDYSVFVHRFLPCGPHLIVLSTTTGQAQTVAVAIDQANEPAIAASLAGDDTVFVATRNRRSQVVALRRLQQWFGDKK